MRTLRLMIVALLLVQEHPPKPPDGWVCSNHPKAPADHKCECVLTCTIENGQVVPQVSKTCRVWCWEKTNCACSHDGCEGHH